MAVTETVSVSWFSRVQSSIKGILVGIMLFLLAFVLLFWNEGRAVQQYEALKEGATAVVPISATTVDPVNDGKLVHISAAAKTASSAIDPVFAVGKDALRVSRVVEMFQWKQNSESTTEKKLGGSEKTTTTYTYTKKWLDSPVSSGDFKEPGHENPSAMPFETATFNAETVAVGAFHLSASQIQRIDDFKNCNLDVDYAIPAILHDKAKIHDGGLYLGADPMNPAVGDVRIRFKSVPSGIDVSLVAVQTHDTFQPFQTKSGNTVSLLMTGSHDAQSMFAAARSANNMTTWLLRVVGFAMMFFGLNLIMAPLSVIADVIPFIGSLVSVGTSLVALLLALPLSLLTIAIAWLAYRPVLGISILVVAGALVFVLVKKMKAKPEDKPAAV